MSALSSGSITPSALLGRRFFIVADLTIGGARVFAATAELAIPWANGDTTICVSHYLSRPITVTLDAGWGKSENTPGEATIESPMSGRLLDVLGSGALASGSGRCEVFLWIEGDDYDRREVLVSGPIRLAQWGAPGEAVVLSVRQDTGKDQAPIRIGVFDESFATLGGGFAVEENVGRPYPIVFGVSVQSGALSDDAVYRSEGIPYSRSTGTPSTYQRICVAGHRVEATEVWIKDSTGLYDQLPITYRQDGAGGTFATVNLVGSSLAVDEGTTYAVKWSVDGGGLVDGGRVVRGAGQLAEFLLRRSGLPVDLGRLAGARLALDAYEVAGTIQEPVGCLSYIGDALGAVLPFTLTAGPDGFWPWPWPLQPRRSEAVAHIDPERGDAVRSSEIAYDSGNTINEITTSYRFDVDRGDMTASVTIGGESTTSPLGACINSQNAQGVRAESVEAVVFEDAGAASRAAVARLAALSSPRGRVSYDLSTSYGWLRPRQIVTVNDADVGAYGVAVVDSIELSEVGSSATILILVPTGAQ